MAPGPLYERWAVSFCTALCTIGPVVFEPDAPQQGGAAFSDYHELLENPRTAACSRIKYLQRQGTKEQHKEFLNGLFLAAFEGKYAGDWDALIALLERWEDVAIDGQFRSMTMPDGDIPWAALGKPLDRAKIALVTTVGIYVEGQNPFERGDTTYREIPRDAANDQIRIWHPGYDKGPATEDINCIYPIDRFAELESEGEIGELAGIEYSFMGLINDTGSLIGETAPGAARRLKEQGGWTPCLWHPPDPSATGPWDW